jgi:hypothetical protein
LDGISLRVVVEIGEDIQPIGKIVSNLRRPGGKELAGVAP